MWLIARIALLMVAALAAPAWSAPPEGLRVARTRPYRPDTCAYCGAETWCEQRDNGKPQCRGCKVVRFFERVLYPPFGYHLQTWQEKALRELYGKVKPESGLRQYSASYISMGKQNGKSFLIGGLPLYHLVAEDDELNPEAYGVAAAKDQAGIVFKAAAGLVNVNPRLKSLLKILESTKRITRRDGGGIYCVLSADGEVQDGKRPSLLLIDELHRFTRKKAETVRTVLMKGMISRAPVVDGVQTGEPLMIQTTTSGDERESPLWYSEYEYARQVIEKVADDPSYYAVIYQADPKRIENEPDYWKSREARESGNPSHEAHGGFLADAALEAEMKKAVLRPELRIDYIRLNLNVPMVATGTPVVDMPTWYANGGPDDLRTWAQYDDELLIMRWGLKGRPCHLGFDMSWTTDLAGMSLVFPPQTEGEKWKFLFYAWLPEERLPLLERVTRAALADWKHRGFLYTMPGHRLKVFPVEEKIRWARDTFDLRSMCYDPYRFQHSAESLAENDEIPSIEIDQKISALTNATKEFLDGYINFEFQHGNNPIMNWHMSCLALKHDRNDNVAPDKPQRDKAQRRIDLVSATVNALTQAPIKEDREARVLFI